jgi:D-psicose/D-tagatose/L-ribulose 3-epimerase
MKFGVNTFIWSGTFGATEFHLLPEIKRAGFDGVEIPIFQRDGFDARAARNAIESAGLECTVCAVLTDGLSLISEDAGLRDRALTRVREIISVSAEAGAHLIAGPLYSPVGYLPGRRRTPDEWNRAVDAWRKLGDTLNEHDVTVAIEPLNRFETFFLNTAADAAKLCDEIGNDRIGILFDTFHANIEEKSIADGYRRCGAHLKHVHTCENDRGIPGSGHVEWVEVFRALRDLNYGGWLTIESFGFNIAEIAAAAAIWRDIERTPAEIAFEGVKFLKRSLPLQNHR